MRRNYIKYIAISLLCLLTVSCTEVDICESELHPHIAKINVDYNWEDGSAVEDSMVVLAYRVVNSWRSGFILDAATGMGRSLYDTDNLIYELDTVKNDNSSFYTKCGEICFTTFNNALNNENLSVPNVKTANPAAANANIGYKKSYTIGNFSSIEPMAENWTSYNTYTANYVSAMPEDIYYQTIKNRKIEAGNINYVEFHPRGVLQEIEINLNIKAEGVAVKNVAAEVSGISSNINIFNGTPFGGTYKTLFELQKNASLYTGTMKVLGLARNNSFTSLEGNGVIQVAVHTDNGHIYYAQMNMFNAINIYGDVITGGSDKVVLNIDAPLVATTNELKAENPEMFADKWVIK